MKKIWFLLILMVRIISVTGQSLQSLIPSLPTSPQAEAFKMYGDYAVNPSTGIPDISIPLYEMNHHSFKLPLVLKYTPKPIKPGYNYDLFGFGWALSTNGCVSRTIEYVPDEWRKFQLEAPGSPRTPNHFNQCTGCLKDYNYAHDKFNAVLPNGTSFDFIIDNQYGNIIYQVSNGHEFINCYNFDAGCFFIQHHFL